MALIIRVIYTTAAHIVRFSTNARESLSFPYDRVCLSRQAYFPKWLPACSINFSKYMEDCKQPNVMKFFFLKFLSKCCLRKICLVIACVVLKPFNGNLHSSWPTDILIDSVPLCDGYSFNYCRLSHRRHKSLITSCHLYTRKLLA